MSTKQEDNTTFDPSQRRLCPDGSCVGLLDGDGKCRVCGAGGSQGTGVVPAAGSAPVPPSKIDDEPRSPPASGDEVSGFDPKRRLCPDDACIGVIGKDNTCSLCGRHG